jgi:tetratricopeptide (TPR) repeat protein
MVVRLHTMDGKTKVYDTYRGEGGEENGPTKYVTKCGMEWKRVPKPYETCDHIDCARDVLKGSVAGGWVAFLIFLVMGTYLFFMMKDERIWAFSAIGLCILFGVRAVISGSKAEDKFKELTEYKNKGTINGVRAYKAPEFEELVELRTAKECIDMGLFLYDKSKYDGAVKAFDKAIELDPNSTAAWNSKGVALKAQNRFDEAIVAYDKAIELNPPHWKTSHLYSDPRIMAYDKVIEFNPQLADAWFNKGRALYDQDKYSEAIIAYDRAVEINPRLAGAWYSKGRALRNQGKYDEAILAYNKAIEIDPKDADVWYNKGIALRWLGRTTEADSAFADAIDKWNSTGMDLSRLEKYAEAIKVYDMALAVDPNYVYSWINKGTAFFRLGMHEEAIAAFNQVIKIDPQNADAWNRKGIVLKKIGHKVESTDAFAKAKELGYTG